MLYCLIFKIFTEYFWIFLNVFFEVFIKKNRYSNMREKSFILYDQIETFMIGFMIIK